MAIPSTLRSLLALALGLVVGCIGAGMFLESMPGEAGSDRARADQLDQELKRVRARLAALEAPGHSGSMSKAGGPKRTFADGARSIAEDIKEGRLVNPDDILRTAQPVMRDLAPLFDRMRVKQQKQMIDALTGEVTREYKLSPEDQAKVRAFFEQKAASEADRWNTLVTAEGTRIQDLMRSAQDIRPDEGIDPVMESILTGDELADFRSKRTAQRVERLQHEADATVERLNSIVGLDPKQSDQVFGIVARGSKDYDPTMVLEGVGGDIGSTPSGNPRQAILSVLTPEQRAAYDAEKQRKREETAKEMESMGLALPADWELFDRFGF